jgi:hypothetical protein
MAINMRPSQSLRLWQQVALQQVRDKAPDLSTRQMAILLTIYLDPPPHTVRGLARSLNVTKPVITRALDTMGAMDLVSRHRDEADRRNVLVRRTVKGALGPAAIMLEGGTVIYSMPTAGPLNDSSYVMPGAVRAKAEDLQAITPNLARGTKAYFF